MLGPDRFWMELHAVHRQVAGLQTHDRAVLERGGDLKALRQACAFQHQRVIARGPKGLGHSGKDTAPVVLHLA